MHFLNITIINDLTFYITCHGKKFNQIPQNFFDPTNTYEGWENNIAQSSTDTILDIILSSAWRSTKALSHQQCLTFNNEERGDKSVVGL